MKKIISVMLCILMLLSAFMLPCGALFDSGDVTSKLHSAIYYMENLEEGTVFFDKDSEKQHPIAGFSKVIAAIVALEKWGNLDGSITVTKESLAVFNYYGYKTALYKEGETVSKKELFDCLMVYSASDVLSIIAYDVSGNAADFLKEMQALCDKIGCTSTVLKNLGGFDEEGQYTTARDIAKIIKYGYNYPLFVDAFSMTSVTLKATDLNSERVYTATNRMTNAGVGDYYHSSVSAGKHTTTTDAGECIAVMSNKDGYSYLTVVLGGMLTNVDQDDINENTSMTDAKRMLSWVYDNIRYRTVVSPTQTVEIIKVVAGKGTDTLRLVPEAEVTALVPSSASPDSVKYVIVEGTLPDKVTAPVEAGEVIAQAKVYYAHQEIATVNLVAANTIEMSVGGLIASVGSSVIGSVFFMLVITVLTIIAVAFFVINLIEYIKKSDEAAAARFRKSVGRKPSGAVKKNKNDTGNKKV